MVESIIQELEVILPNHFHRKTAVQAMDSTTGGLLKARSLANMDSRGDGPGGTLVKGKRMYEKPVFLAWLRTYLEKSGASVAARKSKKAE